MRLTLFTQVLGLAAALILWVGIYAAVEVGLGARGWFGQSFEVRAFWAAMLVLTGVAAGLYRWQESLLGWLAPLVGGMAPDVMYCQTCGATARHDVSFCPQGSGTSFGIAKPDPRETGSRWSVQVGMDVIASGGQEVGVIKRRGARAFSCRGP